jgi:membrane protease YdiL (CAAX protease family)
MPSNRIPNLLHFVILLGMGFFALVACQAIALALPHSAPSVLPLVFAEVLTLNAAWFFFPPLWQRPFLEGLRWNAAKARPRLALLGLAMGFAAQGISLLIPHPKELPIEEAFHNPGTVWVLALFGVVIGPLFEEVVFRGFLLPGIANAFDYVRIPPDPDPQIALERLVAWRASSGFSRPALVVASLITSLLFASIHAPQLGYTWAAVALLSGVSLVLCWVRIRTGSVAASTAVHACYNLSIFVTLFVSTGGFRHLDAI